MKITKYMGMAFAIATLAACNNDEDFTSAWQNDPAAMKVNATVGSGIFTRSNPLGADETAQKAFNSGDKISIAAGTQGAETYTLTNGTWTPETGKYLKWETGTMDITAYYPVAEGASAQTFTLPTDQADGDKIVTADYMTFSGSKSKPADNGELMMEMERKTSRVIVKIEKFNDQFGNTVPTVTNVKIKSGAASYAAGEAAGAVTGVTTYAQHLNADAAQVGTTYTALVIPTEIKADESFITLNVNGTALTVKGIPAMEAGKSYTYNLTIGKVALTVGEVTVTGWTNGTIDGGEASVIPNFWSYTKADYYQWDAETSVSGANPNWNDVQEATTDLFKACPTAQDIVDYLVEGFYWDNGDVSDNGLQTYSAPTGDGSSSATGLHKGIWLKKKDKLTKKGTVIFDGSYFNGIGYKNTINERNAAEIRTGGDYFFLPATGRYDNGSFGYTNEKGHYWTRTRYPTWRYSHRLKFGVDDVQVGYELSYYGYLPMVGE